VYCSPDCVMQVSVSIGTQGEGGTEFFAAPFDPSKPWQDELAARLPTIVDNGGHERHGHGNNPVKVQGIARTGGPNDRILEERAGTLEPAQTVAAEQCLAVDHYAAVHVAYGATGKLARCEPSPERLGGAVACVCRALAGRTGTPNTRERLAVALRDPAPAVSKDKLKIFAYASPAMVPDPGTGRYKAMTTDPAIDLWDPPEREALAPCFTDATGKQELAARATLDFDAAGKATKLALVPTTGTFTAAQQACVKTVLLTSRLPCPSISAPQATVELKVTIGGD
jgi:hypothetical protein